MNLGNLSPDTDKELRLVVRLFRVFNKPVEKDGYYYLELPAENYDKLMSFYKERGDDYFSINREEWSNSPSIYGVKLLRVETITI